MPRLKYHELAPGREILARGKWMSIEEMDPTGDYLFAADQDGEEYHLHYRDIDELYPTPEERAEWDRAWREAQRTA